MEDDAPRPEPGGLEPSRPPEGKPAKETSADRLRKLEEEVAKLKADMEPEAPPEAEEEGEPEGPPRELTAAERVELDNLVKQAQLAKIRKQVSVATDLLKKAAALAPRDPIVLEALGDDLMDRRIFKAAKEAYGKALKQDPTNVALDKKYGQAVYESDVRAATFSMDMPDGPVASSNASMFLAIFLPGSGQMVRGKWAKGLFILVGFLVSLAVVIVMYSGDAKKTQQDKFLYLIPIGSAIIFWVWGFLDASIGGKGKGPRPPIDRPKPPVDLPFE